MLLTLRCRHCCTRALPRTPRQLAHSGDGGSGIVKFTMKAIVIETVMVMAILTVVAAAIVQALATTIQYEY